MKQFNSFDDERAEYILQAYKIGLAIIGIIVMVVSGIILAI